MTSQTQNRLDNHCGLFSDRYPDMPSTKEIRATAIGNTKRAMQKQGSMYFIMRMTCTSMTIIYDLENNQF